MTAADETPAQLPRVGEGGSNVGDDETPAQPTTHVHECACNRNWGGPCGQCVCEPDVRLGVGPAPDGNAGGADVYEAAARLTLAGLGEDNPSDIMLTSWSGDRTFRAGVDAAHARMTAVNKVLSHAAAATDIPFGVDAAGVAELMDALLNSRADLAEAIRERDEARAKTGGGEWVTRYYGDAEQAVGNRSWSTVSRPAHTHRRRVWVGPVEAVSDDGGAG